MPKLRVVESSIFDGSGGFWRGVEPFVGFGLPLGCGVVLGLEGKGFWVSDAAHFSLCDARDFGCRLGTGVEAAELKAARLSSEFGT